MNYKSIERFEQESPLRLVSKLNRMTLNSIVGPLADIGIARGLLPFLMEVLRREGAIQEDITRALVIDRAATARALQQLEEAGFVRREEDPEDRRRKRVYATDKARDLREDVMAILRRQKAVLFTGFDEEEQAQFLAMLNRMIGNIFAATET